MWQISEGDTKCLYATKFVPSKDLGSMFILTLFTRNTIHNNTRYSLKVPTRGTIHLTLFIDSINTTVEGSLFRHKLIFSLKLLPHIMFTFTKTHLYLTWKLHSGRNEDEIENLYGIH